MLLARLIICFSLLFAAEPPEPELPRHLALAHDLLRDTARADSDYQHRPTIVRWKSADAPAACRADCSGLINSILKESYGLTSAQLESWLGRQRPLAVHYQRTIARGKDFDRITNVHDIRPGDIVAIRYPPDSDNSGHVMLADAAAESHEQSPPLIDGLAQFTLRIIDSSKVGHGPGDSRLDSANIYHPGLGTGIIRLYAEPDGTIAGYTSSTAGDAKFFPISRRPISVGRVNRPESAVQSPPTTSSVPPHP